MSWIVPGVLLLGDPRLRVVCSRAVLDEELKTEAARLLETLDRFRAQTGFGRGIAAPQIGVLKRMIALRMDGWPEIILNPEIVWRSDADHSLWDDCMSFPFLLVRLRRRVSISVRFETMNGQVCLMERLAPDVSELLQHEIDHLDGVLAVDHALDREALVAREEFEANVERYRALVEYGAVRLSKAAP